MANRSAPYGTSCSRKTVREFHLLITNIYYLHMATIYKSSQVLITQIISKFFKVIIGSCLLLKIRSNRECKTVKVNLCGHLGHPVS